MSGHRDAKKADDEGGESMYDLDPNAVVQETKLFNELKPKTAACRSILSKVLFILSHGERLSEKDATEVFFNSTKLFQSKDIVIRRLLYVVLKELSEIADDVLIAVNSLAKDVNGTHEVYRASAIRTLVTVADHTMLGPLERYLRQAVVDKSAMVASAALLAGLRLVQSNPEVVKWVSEVQEVFQNRPSIVQYHALALLLRIRQNDALSISKIVLQSARGAIRSPLAHVLLIRNVQRLLLQPGLPSSIRTELMGYLEKCFSHKSEMVIMEAIRAVLSLPGFEPRDLASVAPLLQLFLNSPKPVVRYMVARALHRIALVAPSFVSPFQAEMNNLIEDPNRAIATLAITTLLKTGSEGSVDRLLRQIGDFIASVSDDNKIIVVTSLRDISLRYPDKHRSVLMFLSKALNGEGGFEFKKVIVETFLLVLKSNEESREVSLNLLCEFVEDCEFTQLSQEIIHLLGEEGPKTSQPGRYVRSIYNRLILDNSSIRAAAVVALGKIALACPDVRKSVLTLLGRHLSETDDEVRDRIVLVLCALKEKIEAPDAETFPLEKYITKRLNVPLKVLESFLTQYRDEPGAKEINVAGLEASAKLAQSKAEKEKKDKKDGKKVEEAESFRTLQQLATIPELAKLGPVLGMSEPVPLTEAGTEYSVVCTKYLMQDHIVLAYTCHNTVEGFFLENAFVEANLSGLEGLEEQGILPIESLPFNEEGVTYTILRRTGNSIPLGSLSNVLKFVLKEIDPTTGQPEMSGEDDEYVVEDLELTIGDHLLPNPANFVEEWEEIGSEGEESEMYELGSMGNVAEATSAISKFLGATVVNESNVCPPGAKKHVLMVSGKVSGRRVLISCRLQEQGTGVALSITVRSDDPSLASLVVGSIV